MRTLLWLAILLLVSATIERVDGQTPLSGELPRPLELIDPNGAAPTPPAPGPYVPPTGSRYVPAEGIQAAPADNRPAPSAAQPMPSYGAQSSAAYMLPSQQDPGQQPPDISPNNPEKWRYVYRNGGWWYYTPTRQWMYWSDGRWVQYARPAVSSTSVYVQPPVASRPRFNIGVGVGPSYYPYGPYPYGAYPYGGYGYPYGPYSYGGNGRVGVGIGVY